MLQEHKSLDNFDRLKKHLKDGSLAVHLVEARRSPGEEGQRTAMTAILKDRLEQVRKSFDDKN
jgi:hypothetical protein